MAFRDSLDRFEQFATDVILERRFGKRAMLLRWFLYGLSWLFRAGVQTRLWLHRNRIRKARQLGVAVTDVFDTELGDVVEAGRQASLSEERASRLEDSLAVARGVLAKRAFLALGHVLTIAKRMEVIRFCARLNA